MTDLVLWWAPIPGTAQEAFFDDDTPEGQIVLRGGYGSGKTMTLTAKVLKLSALNAPLPVLWTVPDYGHIEDTILPTLESTDPATGHPWFLSAQQYRYYHRRHLLTWLGGGPIQFVTAENPDSIAGPNVAAAALDEPGRVEHAAWKQTVARVRHPGATLRQTVAAGTPEGLNWLAEQFGADRAAHHHVYEMPTAANTELLRYHPGYLNQIRENATDAEVASYLGGQIVNLTGALAYPMFDAEQHWRPDVPVLPNVPLRISFDFNVDPMACVLGQQIPGPTGLEVHVIDAIVISASTVMEVCAEILRRYPRWPSGVMVYGDATGRARSTSSRKSNYDWIGELLAPMGTVTFKVPRDNPSVLRRLNSVNRLFRDARGAMRLFLRRTEPARACPLWPLVRSLQQTQRKAGTETIWKRSGETVTHASDALGYWLDAEFPAEVPRPLITTVSVPTVVSRVGSQTMAAVRAAKAARWSARG